VANLDPMEIGLIFWAEGKALPLLQQLKGFGLRAGQLGVPPSLNCELALDEWAKGLQDEQVTMTSSACAYEGEDYSSRDIVHKTVGFTAKQFRAERVSRTKDVADFVSKLGIPSLSCHIGLIPEDTTELLYKDLLDLTRDLCDHCGKHGQSFALETGQESAPTLLSFLHDVDRKNLKVNFDPANMIMHGSGDPIAALNVLSDHVLSVHCKDGRSPIEDGSLGKECALGDGEVDFPAFLRKLKQMEYKGLLTIEREEPDAEQRAVDIRLGIVRLQQWKKDLG
jgi:L-ribulose-5-phosphate 3-epimerase